MGYRERFEKLFGRRAPKVPSPEESRQRRERFEQNVRDPDWELVAEVLGDVPPKLRSLYATDVVVQSDWSVVTSRPEDSGAYEIDQFEALRPESREHMWPELEHGCLVIADDGFGNQFFLRAETGPHWPVYFYDHEGGEITQLAESLDAFLGMLQPTQDEDS